MRQKREADSNVGLAAESGRRSGAVIKCGYNQNRKCREISNPEADLQLMGPPRQPGTLQVSVREGSQDER